MSMMEYEDPNELTSHVIYDPRIRSFHFVHGYAGPSLRRLGDSVNVAEHIGLVGLQDLGEEASRV